MDHLREALSFLGEPKTKATPMSNKLIFRINSEDFLVPSIRLKVEINCREHFHVLPWNLFPFTIENPWFSSSCSVTTYQVDELLGTKLRALYQRKKGRDLFDLYTALNRIEADIPALLRCFNRYMEFSAGYIPTTKEFTLNMEEKMKSQDFLVDTRPILLPHIHFDPSSAYDFIYETLIKHIDTYR